MSTHAKAGQGDERFEKEKENRNNAIPEDGSYFGRCFALMIMGKVPETFKNETKQLDKICLGFELPGYEYVNADGNKVPVTTFIEFTNSMNPKANMYKTLAQWSNGQTKKYKDTSDFDLANMLGKPCFLSVSRKVSEGKSAYLVIEGISSVPKGTEVPKAILDQIIVDMEDIANGDSEFVKDDFLAFPPYVQTKVAAGREFIQAGLDLDEIRKFSNDSSDENDSSARNEAVADEEGDW